jgi:hypothetical protein
VEHELKRFCENHDFKGALAHFKGDYKKFSNFVFNSQIPLETDDRTGVGRVLEAGVKEKKHREQIDEHASSILKQELQKPKPALDIIHKAICWLSGLQVVSPEDLKKDTTIEHKIMASKNLLEKGEFLMKNAKDQQLRDRVEASLGFAALNVLMMDDFAYLKNLKLNVGIISRIKATARTIEKEKLRESRQ